MLDDHIKALSLEDEMDDTEIEQLEELRRHGNPDADDDDDECEYYTLPPSRTEMMKDWTSWRMAVNDLMSDVINHDSEQKGLETERKLLTSTNTSKTPDFFRGDMNIHGQRVKDQYGCVAITETDNVETKLEKKIMEGNFYLFGIPRISIKRSSDSSNESIPTPKPYHDRRRASEDVNLTVRHVDPRLSSSFGNLLDAEKSVDLHNRPFQGLAKAKQASMSRRGSLASSQNSLDANPRHELIPLPRSPGAKTKYHRKLSLWDNHTRDMLKHKTNGVHSYNGARRQSLGPELGTGRMNEEFVGRPRSNTMVSVRLQT